MLTLKAKVKQEIHKDVSDIIIIQILNFDSNQHSDGDEYNFVVIVL